MENLYDEFGNYIGPDLDEDVDVNVEIQENDDMDSDVEWHDMRIEEKQNAMKMERDDELDGEQTTSLISFTTPVTSNAVVLHENKQYYPEASELYPEAEIVVGEEDAQPITVPILTPPSTRSCIYEEKSLPKTRFHYGFMASLLKIPSRLRHVAVVGHLHHGKTSFLDLCIHATHLSFSSTHTKGYLDALHDEQTRKISIKAHPISLLLTPYSINKSHVCNFFDTPGHVNFEDERNVAMRMCDGVIVCVDAAEGVLMGTKSALLEARLQGLTIILCISKIDRLILELKLPPADAYLKLRSIVDECNEILRESVHAQFSSASAPDPLQSASDYFSPIKNNVLFCSAKFSLVFTVASFASKYCRMTNKQISVDKFASKLWGNYYFTEDRRFATKPPSLGTPRTFVSFILEPIYKIFSHVLGSEGKELQQKLAEIRVKLTLEMCKTAETDPLLKNIFRQFIGDASRVIADVVVDGIPSPVAFAPEKVMRNYLGNMSSDIAKSMMACNPSGALMVHVVKMFPRADGNNCDAFGRIYSGTLRVGNRIRVLGSNYSLKDPEDAVEITVTRIWIFQTRYRLEIPVAYAGNWVLIEGCEDAIRKQGTLCHADNKARNAEIFKPFDFTNKSVCRIAIEPYIPTELPQLFTALRKVSQTYPQANLLVEESGEHVLSGVGELAMDCMLSDIRTFFSKIEIRLSDPTIAVCETVNETSSMICSAETPNKFNSFGMIAQVLDPTVVDAIEKGLISADVTETPNPVRIHYLEQNCGWDALASRNIWAFGPEDSNVNVLVDDTLKSETNKELLYSIRESIVHGFRWSCREGPLCESPLRSTHFRLLSANITEDPSLSTSFSAARGQIIPTMRRLCYSSVLLAYPRLLEPIYAWEILVPPSAISTITPAISRRRGFIRSSHPLPASPYHLVNAAMPLLDSFGFETEIRTMTRGQAFGQSIFEHWAVMPGDPLDTSLVFRPLEPSPPESLAREVMLKVRRRKGLREDVAIQSFFDEKMLMELASLHMEQ